MATNSKSVKHCVVAIRRNKLDRKADLTLEAGRVVDMPPGWAFTIDCPHHGQIKFEVVYRSFCKFRFARGLLGGERRRIAPEVTAQQAARRWV